jgi:hypothetical protein
MWVWPRDWERICSELHGPLLACKLILKTKDEPELIEKWILHHLSMVGPKALVIFDNQSSDPVVHGVYEKYKDLIQVYGWGLHHNEIHDATRHPDLYGALRKSCQFYAFLDTDEYAYWTDGDKLFSQDLALYLAEAGPCDVFPGLWLKNVPGNADLYHVDPTSFHAGLKWGKPLISARCEIKGFINHNMQLFQNNPGLKGRGGFVVCHHVLLDRARRIRSNILKCLANGFVRKADDIDLIIAQNRLAEFKPQFRLYVEEIQRCRNQEWPTADGPRGWQMAVRPGGHLEFGMPEAHAMLRSFAQQTHFMPHQITQPPQPAPAV